MNRVKLDWDKSMKIHTVTLELLRMREFARKMLRKGKRLQTSREYKKTKKHADFIIQGVKTALNDAKRMHLLEATPELMSRLDECVTVVKKDRKEVEVFLHSIK